MNNSKADFTTTATAQQCVVGEQSALDKQSRIAMAKQFFDMLYSKVTGEHWGYLWTVAQDNRRTTYPFKVTDADQREQMARSAIALSDKGLTVYFGVNLLDDKPPSNKRGTNATVSIQVATICDIDIVGGNHEQSDKKIYAPDFDTAKSFLPFATSLVVNSGYGLHAYCIYEEPIVIADTNRVEAQRRNVGFIKAIRNRAGDCGKTTDGVGDLARVLRVPGTFNYKLGVNDDAPLCRIVEANDVRFTTNELDEKIADLLPQQQESTPQPQSDNPQPRRSEHNDRNDLDKPTEQERAVAMLPFVDGGDYETWYQVGMILKANGNDLGDWERWSATQPNYTPDKHGYSCTEKWATFPETCAMSIATLHDWAIEGGYSEKDFQHEWYEQHGGGRDFRNGKKSARDAEEKFAERDEMIDALFDGGTSDRAFAKRLALFCGDVVRWVTDEKIWIVYERDNEHGGGKWRDVGNENSCLAPQLGELADTLETHARKGEAYKHEREVANAFQATRKQMQAVTQFKGLKPIYITSEDLNTHPELLNCQNGVVDLSTGKLMEAAPELLLTQQCAAIYDTRCTDKTFANFLEGVLPDLDTREAVINYLGYCLTADVSAEKYLNIYGRGGNGKGVLLLTLRILLGDYACELSPDAVLEGGRFSDATGRATTELTPLVGRRLGIVDELPRGAHFDVAKVNRLTGRDFLPVRKLRREGEDVPPTHKLIMCGNYFPRIDDPRADSVLRRLVAVKFEVDFTQDPDTTLKDRLQAPEALSGALNVLVPAAIEFYKHGLRKPSSLMNAARDDLLGASDFIGDFLDEFYEFGDGLSVPRKDLIGHLRNACRDECARYNDRELAAMLSKVEGVTYKKDNHNLYTFYGLEQRLAPPD